MLLYFVPMIITQLWLYYFVRINEKVIVTNGVFFSSLVISFVPFMNMSTAILGTVVWIYESDWSNEEFKWPW